MKQRGTNAFTLVELLIVMAVMAILAAIMLPALAGARGRARQAVCATGVRSLALANIGYAAENQDRFVIAAADLISENLRRWHGRRDSLDDPFEPRRGPLVRYLSDGLVKQCPQQVAFRHGEPWQWDFEDGCGGYGYNLTYLGSRLWTAAPLAQAYQGSAKAAQVAHPSDTLMFADAAMAKRDEAGPYYLEYSFVEPPLFLGPDGRPCPQSYASPSIHFRHGGRANLAWTDGHVDARTMTPFDEVNAYGVLSRDMCLGWFGPLDNRLFDLQ